MKLPGSDVFKGKWKQHTGAAKITWGELTDDEIMKSEGHQEKLCGIIQERYGITRDEANRQYDEFRKNLKH
jgi:uncharacterized protein YjbJ (UPF0337 family)